MKILITGASGFVGGALAAHLRGAGHEIIAHSRTPRDGFSACALDDESALKSLMEGVDAIIHAGARKTGRRVAHYMIDNRDATLRLYDLAAQMGVGRFIFFSAPQLYSVFILTLCWIYLKARPPTFISIGPMPNLRHRQNMASYRAQICQISNRNWPLFAPI